jgi:septal ring factor EnvC (AmiA/AmiB activator)
MISVVRQSTVRPGPAILAAVGLCSFAHCPALAQEVPRPSMEVPYLNNPLAVPPTAPDGGSAAGNPAGAEANVQKQREQELATLRAEQRKALENEARLKREIDSLGDDRRKLNQQLIDAAAGVRGIEDQIARSQDRLKPLDEREQTLRTSLEGRRKAMAEVLAALQRIGRQPSPAIVVRSEDALQSLRSAMLLGAVLPEMRHEAEVLIADLGEIARVRQEIAEERSRLDNALKAFAEGNLRLTLLIDQRQKQQSEAEKALAAERQRAALLARQAANLQELIAKLDPAPDTPNPPNRSTRLAARSGDEKKGVSSRPDLAAINDDPGRLAPAVAFASIRGKLPLPVNGVRLKEFGAPDGLGGTEKGLTIAARPGAQITSPCDGWVVYAGPFRNYGQLLILNAGGGYHVLVAGMERISVDLGQFVVTGEPVAVMGGRVQAAAALAVGSGQPVLYVEFRKDGTPVDPGPWWAASESEKVRG